MFTGGGLRSSDTYWLANFNRANRKLERTSSSPVWSAILGRCPRCARGRLFAGYLKISEACDNCNLGFSAHDAGDGPVVPVMLIVGPVVAGSSFWLEFSIQPSLWLHLVIWPPLILILCLGLLRPFKAIFIGAQFKFRSVNGEFPDGDDFQNKLK